MGSPGVLFAHPARSRRYRHQTNSFSYDESERSSAAYEQDISFGSSSAASGPEQSLHDELRGSQMDDFSDDGILVPEMVDFAQDTTPRRLQLPPPFSTTPRSTSGPVLPIIPDATPFSRTSRIRRVAAHLLSSYRASTPRIRSRLPTFGGSSGDPTPSPTPRPSRVRQSSDRYRIYDDSMSPYLQPQTPEQLPEARHQSRYHSAYTAPSINQRLFSMDGPAETSLISRVESLPARNFSPDGLREPGMRGLYGGRENGDEVREHLEGIRASNAEMRRWATRGAREAEDA